MARLVVGVEVAPSRGDWQFVDSVGRRVYCGQWADREIAPLLFTQLPAEVRYVLDDQHYNTPELRAKCGRHKGAYQISGNLVERKR